VAFSNSPEKLQSQEYNILILEEGKNLPEGEHTTLAVQGQNPNLRINMT